MILGDMFADVTLLLPTERLRNEFDEKEGYRSEHAADVIGRVGVRLWLGRYLPQLCFLYPDRWWGAPEYLTVVDQYCAMEPPYPETFRNRMASAPWELSDEQAEFVTDHRWNIRVHPTGDNR